jgi:Flp pilus assembly protein TadG
MRTGLQRHRSMVRPWTSSCAGGQGLVEFALIFPIFVVILLGMIEFSFVYNAVLSANYATRDGSLIAAEAGSNTGADCEIISKVLADMTAPADSSNVTQIIIYRANVGGGPYGGSYSGSGNVWSRTGSTDCSTYGGSASLPFTLTTGNYPEGLPDLTSDSGEGTGGRCDYLNGCPSNLYRTRDTVGVQISYTYTWHTPLGNFVGLPASGFSILRSNEMRMEPIL